MTSPFAAITPDQEQTALDSITKMLTGSQMLKDEPGVVYSLAQAQAHPADAGAIDQFMQGLDAEKQVRIAQAAGSKITLSPEQKTLLGGLGVDYSGVEFTQQNAAQDTIAKYAAQGQKVKTNPDGSLALDGAGNVQVEQPNKYKAKGLGRLFQTLHNDILKPVMRDAITPTLHGMNDAWNVVDSTLGGAAKGLDAATKDLGVAGDFLNPVQAIHQIWDSASGKSVQLAPKLGNLGGDFRSAVGGTDDQLTQMQQAGYDPTNFFSVLAYRAKGLAHSDMSPLATQWDDAHPNTGPATFADALKPSNGQEAVQTALAFTENPKNYVKTIENDATLTPDQVAAKIKMLSSPDFVALTRKVQASRSSIGNEGAYQLGIDPVKHATAFTLASAGIDLAASFLIDPTIMAGKGVQLAKLNQIGIDSLGDATRAASNLAHAAELQKATGLKGIASRLTQPFSGQLANGWQRGIDLSDQIREANAAGDRVSEAALTAKFNAELPTLGPLLPDFLGKDAITGFDKATGKPILGETDGIRSLDDAVTYVASKAALTRLMNGRAAVQSSLTPGALSNFGVRKLKGAVAGWMTTRSAERSLAAYDTVVSAAKADPALAEKLISEGDLLRLQPQADDAVSAITEEALSRTSEASAGGALASAQRGAVSAGEFSLTAQGKGKALYNLRATGAPVDGSRLGWASPTAIAARSRLAAQRFTTMLPRNTLLDIEDAQTGDKIYKMAMTYMNRGDARMLQAAFNAGDGGARKLVINGLIDQLGHAAGFSKTSTGQRLLDSIKANTQAYSSAGDEITVNGENVALHAGQVRTKWLLPTFRDMKLAASKVGLWEATMGRPLNSEQADKLMVQWKMGALFKPSTVTRNQLEGWLRTALEGQLGAALKSRAMLTMPNKELWERGYALESKTEYERLLTDGDLKGAREIANGNMLAGDVLGRSKPTHTIAQMAPFALAGRAYRKLYGRAMTEDDFRALESMGAQELSEAMEGYGQQILQHELGNMRAARESAEIAKAGFGPATFMTAMRRGLKKASGENTADGQITNWVSKETDGDVGVNRYANALAMRVNPTPNVARAVLDRIENPQQFDINHIVKALDDPAIARQMHRTSYGSLFWEDGSAVARRATSDAEVMLGKQEWAQKLVNDYAYLLSGQNGKYQEVLAKEIRQTGKAPDAAWIDKHLSGDNRPHSVLAPEVMAMPNGGVKGIINALQDVEGAGYQWMVERPLQRTTSSPVFWANYAKARKGLDAHVEKMVESGVSREAAEAQAKELAIKNAWVKTEQLIDDPGQKSQFDIVARNLFPFSRATQAMVRRWGSGLWQDPARARKMMLAYEGGTQSGLIYNNVYGEPTFTYPGSGVMNMFMREIAKIPGLESLARFPVSASMTGGVLMSVPGADNPLRMSMGPMISVPMREIFKLFPSNREGLDKVDAAINGPIGVGETWTQFMPTAVRKVFTAMNTDQRNSALASSTIGAIANLGAAGLVPGIDASPSERDAFFKRIQQQSQNQLYLRAIFGLFAPAAPSTPTEGTTASQADYAFHMQGIGQLSDEYKTILNDVHGDLARANAIFTALHPDSAAWFETGHSQANASKVSLPSTAAALNWMSKNAGFVSKYNSVAAYFLPESTGNEPFDDQAYKAQLELGLRQRKTPSEFYNDVRVRNAEGVFYPTVDGFNQRIAEAKKSGNTDVVRQLTDQKSAWEKDFKNQNPLFAAKIDSYPDARAQATGQLADLKKMVADGAVPDGYGPLLSNLIGAYDGLVNFQQTHPGSTNEATAMRSQAQDMFNSWVTANVANTPLADLYSGVFRTLDTNLVNLQAPGGN